ncbi:MAG: GGDEF domain-containing protein [Gallionellaceae bacterium]|jgi:diguanylate cyclase (GGDEF)-like protein
MQLLTTRQVIIRISASIAAAEFLIMLLINIIPYRLNAIAEAALDVIMLSALTTPLIYLWIIKPFVDARDEAHAQVSYLAFTDPLTQLANRRQLLSHLQGIIAGCNRHKTYGALLLIDLDGFKTVNDMHGHDAGDAVLVSFAKHMRESIRAEDFASRLGGDEFVVLIDRIDANEQHAREKILKIADKIIQLANTPVEFNGNTLQVGASIGITLLGFEHLDADAAIRKSDVAMYRSKKAGKGRAGFSD